MSWHHYLPWLTGSWIFSSILLFGAAQAQIAGDGTVGTQVNGAPISACNGGTCAITGGTVRGTNLFHSFREFSVPTGGTALFDNAPQIQTILTRITGSSASTIDGLLQTNGTANLFLLNPNGILFGPNARLQIGGSFLATTASSFKFPDGSEFSAINSQPPPLLTVNPSALWFNQANAAPITVQARNNGPSFLGGNLLLVGGDVRLDGAIIGGPDKRVELGGLAVSGPIGLIQTNSGLGLQFPEAVGRSDVTLSNGAIVNVQGKGRGEIAIHSRNLALSGSSFLIGGINSGLGTAGTQAGDIALDVTAGITLQQGSIIANNANSNSIGNSGNITIQTGSLAVLESSGISSIHQGQGNAGNVDITARDTATISSIFNSNSIPSTVVSSGLAGSGNAGNIRITTGSLFLTAGGNLTASTGRIGNGGNIRVDARDAIVISGRESGGISGIFSDVYQRGVGNGGQIQLTTGSLTVSNGAQLRSDTAGRGNTGTINIRARNAVTFDGEALLADGVSSSVAVVDVLPGAIGNAGDIQIDAGSLMVANGAALATSSGGKGNAGNILINAREAVTFAGQGQNVIGTVAGRASYFSSRAFSVIASTGVGNGGAIQITTGALAVTRGARLDASTYGRGDGGNILLNVRDRLLLDGADSSGFISQISSQVAGVADNQFRGIGRGGDIRISSGSVIVSNGAELSVSTSGQGDAGTITVNTRDGVTVDGTGGFDNRSSSIDASVNSIGVGRAGDLQIAAESLQISNGGIIGTAVLGRGDGGNIAISTRKAVTIDGTSADGTSSSGIITSVGRKGIGKGGDLRIAAGSVQLSNSALIKASSAGRGNAGAIVIEAKDGVSLDTLSLILSNIGSEGGAPAIGDVGSILIEANDISLKGTAQLQAGFFAGALGNPGVVSLRARNSVFFTGKDTGIFSNVDAGGVGRGSDIRIAAKSVLLTDGAVLTADNRGRGDAGSIDIDGGVIRLDKSASLVTGTVAGNGGNINLRGRSYVLLRHNSSILSSAGLNNEQTNTGNGGNITIQTPFLISALNENSDIVANAVSGRGGNVTVNAQGIFNFVVRNRAELEQLFGSSNLNQTSDLGGLLPTNDIIAISRSNPTLNGQIVLNTPNVDPTRGLVVLPVNLTDPSNQIAQSCKPGEQSNSSFTALGRGGLPPNPMESLTGESILSSWATLAETSSSQKPASTAYSLGNRDQMQGSRSTSSSATITEAQGWIKDEHGNTWLLAQAPLVVPHDTTINALTCH